MTALEHDLLAALKALAHEATWDEDSDRAAFDCAMDQAEAAIARAEARVAERAVAAEGADA